MPHRSLRPAAFAAGLALVAVVQMALGAAPPAARSGSGAATPLHVAPPMAVEPIRPAPPLVTVPRSADARLPVTVESLQVDVDVAGAIAQTRIELTLRNPNDRPLEGRVQFPLQPGQAITGFALDFDGRLRDAVPVPKAQGRQVFEDVTRARVDPALLETTQGENQSIRVYPLPAHGTRRVRLELTEALPLDARGARAYRLPIEFAGRLASLAVDVRVAGVRPDDVTASVGAASLPVQADATGARATTRLAVAPDVPTGLVLSDRERPGLLDVRIRDREGAAVVTEAFRGDTYFHAEIPAPHRADAPRATPRTVAIVWDASGSGATRDHAREVALLDAYFRKVRATRVSLTVVRDVVEPVETFTIAGGRWDALRERLRTMTYDGATSRELWTAARDADLALLFTDGLANYGVARTIGSARSVPTFAFGAATSADAAALRAHAETTGGEYVDLALADTAAALRRLTHVRPRLVAIGGIDVADALAASPFADGGRYVVSGRLTAPRAELVLTTQDGGGRRETQRVSVIAVADARPFAARQWAQAKVAALAADASANAAAIERLGLEFRLPTPATSLLVLDAAADYARWNVEPPAGEPAMVAEVARLRAAARADGQRLRRDQLARVAAEYRQRAEWWTREFPKDSPPAAKIAAGAALEAAVADGGVRADRARANENRASAETRIAVPAAAPPATPAMAASRSAAAPGPAAEAPNDAAPSATVALRRWAPDSRYARRMRAAAAADVYAIYLDERPGYTNSTAFFLDAADILVERGRPSLAARVVSNLAEMDLEDRHVLRILAYRLLQMQRVSLALPVLERVRELAPDEPQSWRDLGLARARQGNAQGAVDALWHVVETPWHGRFPSIETIALAELNAIAAQTRASGRRVDTSFLPPELASNLPVRLRVVLAWDADDTDIDLWVTDPDGERAYYGHRLTRQGGAMSNDFTGGYGPEEFVLRDPKPGRYTVQANFYGHRQQVVAPSTTLMLALTTGFGMPDAKTQETIVRLSGAGDVVDVGAFEIAPTQAKR
jgi:Ca-activated chloride channel family protein